MRTLGRLLFVASVATLAIPITAGTARADTAPPLTCGATQPGPCHQTAHFSDDDEFGTPLPPSPKCPAFTSTDYVHIVGSGNGIEHININKAQDVWFTFTFTGTATLTAYPPSSLSFDDQGNVTGIIGPPDPAVPTFSAKYTEWFGGSFNNRNATSGGTINVIASAPGQSLDVHAVFHANWAVGSDLSGPPTRAFDHVTCS